LSATGQVEPLVTKQVAEGESQQLTYPEAAGGQVPWQSESLEHDAGHTGQVVWATAKQLVVARLQQLVPEDAGQLDWQSESAVQYETQCGQLDCVAR
jgi:hypothetical protein